MSAAVMNISAAAPVVKLIIAKCFERSERFDIGEKNLKTYCDSVRTKLRLTQAKNNVSTSQSKP